MSRSHSMAQLLRLARLAARCERTGESAQEAIGHDADLQGANQQAANQQTADVLSNAARRRLIQGAAAGAVATAAGAMTPTAWAGAVKLRRLLAGTGDVAIVGAGLAGLSCAYALARKGVPTRVFEADTRVGGRCKSLRGFFPGQVAELGGEFINTSHNVMIGYAKAFGLTLEDASMFPGSRYYDFDGQRYSEAQVLEEFRAFSASMREDLQTLRYPTADRHTEADRLFDEMSLGDYLQMYDAGSMLRKMIGTAYAAEYGAGIDELSSISFLRYVYADKRSKFAPSAALGDMHLHVVEGTDRITTGLAAGLHAPVEFGRKLVAVRKLASGRMRLTFDVGGRSVQSDHDAVVITLPFSVLRDVHLHPSLDLPAWKRYAIDNAGMGDNSKLMVGFRQSYWYLQHDSNGSGYSDRANLQCTWETNPINGGDTHAVLSHYTGGAIARAINPKNVQTHARAFLDDLEFALPGAHQMAQRSANGDVVAIAENWSRNPYSKGSYSCARPGYFTTTAHNEAKPIGNLLFAGEHTSSFYEWQGFMEGAALSGLRAAGEACTLLRV